MTMKWVQVFSSLIPRKENIVLFCSAFLVVMIVTLAFIHGVFDPMTQWGLQAHTQSQSPVGANEIESNVLDQWANVDHLITQAHSMLKSFPYLSGDRIGIDTSLSQAGKVRANDYTKAEGDVSAHPKQELLLLSQEEGSLNSSGVFFGTPIIRVSQAGLMVIVLGSLLALWLSVRWGSISAVMIQNLGWLQKARRDPAESVFPQTPTLPWERGRPFVSPHHRMVTVLFVDIRGFSQIAETLSPEEVSGLLGEFYAEMTKAVSHHGGVIDKYMGDAVMALFNVPHSQPDHADRAVSAALDCQHRLHGLSTHFQQRYDHPLVCGFGIHTGVALVGSMGAGHRMDYTVVGDTINLGANLEGLSKVYDVPIVMSESTYQALTVDCHSRYLDEIRVKGRERFDRIYAVTGKDGRLVSRVPLQGHAVVQQLGVRSLGKISDVSTGGVALEQLEQPMIEGSLLDLALHSVDSSCPLSFQAKVIWAQSHRAGFEFLETTQDFQPGIETFLSRSAS